MAVAFDAVGPGATGVGSNGSTNLSWSHTVTGINTAVVVGVACDAATDSMTCTATCNGTSMPSLAKVHTNNLTVGYLQVFGLAGVAAGSASIVVTASSAPTDMNGGSLSFTGVAQSGAFGTAATGFGSSGTATATTAGSTSGNMVAGFMATGTGITSATAPATSRFIENFQGAAGNGAGDSAGATSPGTGSAVSMVWAISADFWAAAAVEVLAGGALGGSVETLPQQLSGMIRRRRKSSQTPQDHLGTGDATIIQTVLATTAVVPAATAVVPQKYIVGLAGGTKGWFVDQGGQPRMFLADEVWGLGGNAGVTAGNTWDQDYDAYLTARAAQGFTVVTLDPYGNSQHGGNDNGTTLEGSVAPFTTPYNVFNETFWTRIDYLLTKAASLGITVNLNVAYTYDFDATKVLNAMTGAQATAYGVTLGNRYKTIPNLLWFFGDDYAQTSETQFGNIMAGIRSTGDTHEMSIEYYPSGTTSHVDLADLGTFNLGPTYATYNWVYYYWVTYWAIETAYADPNPIPLVWGDGYFWGGEGGTEIPATSNKTMRMEVWWALASGARGVSAGSHFVWQWLSTSLAAVTSEGWYTTTSLATRLLYESLAGWQNLLPATGTTLITAGRGTRATYTASVWNSDTADTYVAASVTPDKSLAVLYLPVATTITVDETKLVAGYTATWVDPVTCATSSATPGTTYNSTAKGNNSQGDPDWVLVLQGTPPVLPLPELAMAPRIAP